MRRLKLFVYITIFLAMAVSAQAGVIQPQTFGPGSHDYYPVLTFNQYNGNVADLTGILVETSLTSVGGLAQMLNQAALSIDLNVFMGTYSWLLPEGPTLLGSFSSPASPFISRTSGRFSLGADHGDLRGVQTSRADHAELLGQNLTYCVSDTLLSSFWNQYVGTGTFNITCAIHEYPSVTGGSSISLASAPPSMKDYVTVNSRPTGSGGEGEAGILVSASLLLAAACGGLAVRRARRRRKKASRG